MEQAAELKSKGIDEIVCISINDAFVMAAWGKEHGADGKVWAAFYKFNIIYINMSVGRVIHPLALSGATFITLSFLVNEN